MVKKDSKFSVINYALVAKTHSSMYLMHKYWARKPHNVVSEYIKYHSKEGEIVLDPFCGSGVTPTEALKLDRKAIGLDLDPMAIFISRETAIPIDLDEFEAAFKSIETKVKEKIYQLYKTQCRKCKKDVVAEAFIWKDGKPKEIRYTCQCTSGVQWDTVSVKDEKNIKEIENSKINYWYPDNELIRNGRINVKSGEKVSDLFTKRNLLSLAMILNEIEKIKNDEIKNILEFTFTSTLGQSSKMVFVIRNRGRSAGSVHLLLPKLEVGLQEDTGFHPNILK